jgi:hypothetical protein
LFERADEWLDQLNENDRAYYEPTCRDSLVYAATIGGQLLLEEKQLTRAQTMLELAVATATKYPSNDPNSQQDAASARTLLVECQQQLDADNPSITVETP